MTNTALLQEKIKASGLKLEYLADLLGITRQALGNKISGRNAFNQYEVGILCRALDITTFKDICAIFFAQ